MKISRLTLFIIVLCIIGCRHNNNYSAKNGNVIRLNSNTPKDSIHFTDDNSKALIKNYHGTNKLISIDFNDPEYKDWSVWIKDTVLKSGWFIKYLVKDDSSKYNDLYIEWSNGILVGSYKLEHILESNGASIPFYEGESSKCIFLTHECGSTCSGLLILQKNSSLSFKEYFYVVDYSIPFGQILYLPKRNFLSDSLLEVSLVDLNREKEYFVEFNFRCQDSFKYSCIDSIIFGETKSKIIAKFKEDGKEKIVQRDIDLQ